MIIVQSFHSLKEIDLEFRQTVAQLVQNEFTSFDAFLDAEEKCPENVTFHYYLFFGTQHNLPVGICVAKMTPLEPQLYLPWYKKWIPHVFQSSQIKKHVKWCIGSGSEGCLIVQSKYWKLAREELQKIIFEIEQQEDILAQTIYQVDHDSPLTSHWSEIFNEEKSYLFFLAPFHKRVATYENYIQRLPEATQKMIKEQWRKIYKTDGLDILEEHQHLHFTHGGKKILSLPYYLHDSVLMVEMNMPSTENITLFQRIQYALMKFFEITQATSLVLLNQHSPLLVTTPDELADILHCGFQQKHIIKFFRSKNERITSLLF